MKLIHFLILFCVVSGCRSYAPDPIDWARERTAWSEYSAGAMLLSLAEAQRHALFLNPEINALRARHLASSNAAAQTGWWEDPEVGVDALRMMKGVPKPWILDSALAFTIPVNGVPALERKAAEAYAFADACAIVAAERELMTEVALAWAQHEHTRDRHRSLSHHLGLFEEYNQTVQQLVAAGELDAAEGARFNLDVLRMKADIRQHEVLMETRRHALLRLMGLHPSARVTFEDAGESEVPVSRATAEREDALIRHPRVQEKLARLGASEAELRTEIRRQYPDLKIGPALQSEEGVTRGGLTFGMTLPLWNRNRKAIAIAEGERQQVRAEAVNEWKRLVADMTLADKVLGLAISEERRSEMEWMTASLSLVDAVALHDAGETGIMAVIAAHQTVLTSRLNRLDAEQARKEAQIELERFAE
ncbi:MAG: TolC family protein [Kiritimatiellaeota bacterium]|nr:TolC family protein [Kiritimatiellota bacterium]